MAVAAIAAFALLPQLPDAATNEELTKIFALAGWAVGPVMGLVSLIVIFVLNGLRRLLRIRHIRILHPIVVLIGVCPWCAFGCQLLFFEPRTMQFAKVMIDDVGRQMFLGSGIACILAIVLAFGLLLPSKR
jgi:hypothetical protein